jgi:hypothetical protein
LGEVDIAIIALYAEKQCKYIIELVKELKKFLQF